MNSFKFYKFIKDYDEFKKTHNEEATPLQGDKFFVVLDGQQRLTSLYIGLLGSYTYKEKYKRYDDPNAFKKRRLYLNLFYSPEENDTGKKFDLRFLKDEDAKKSKDGEKWFKVRDVLDFKGPEDISSWLEKNGLAQDERSRNYLETLYYVINQKELI